MRLMTVALCLGVLLTYGDALHAQKNPVVQLETSKGTIKIELYPDKAPVTVKNFLNYVDRKFYDGTLFHRVIANSIIQGGGMNEGLREKTDTDKSIKNEASNGLKNSRGTIAMARMSNPESAKAQFFINVRDNRQFDPDKALDGWGYCVFGKVIEGIEVVDKINQVATGKVGNMSDVPRENVVIKKIRKIP